MNYFPMQYVIFYIYQGFNNYQQQIDNK